MKKIILILIIMFKVIFLSADTNTMLTEMIEKSITTYCEKYKVEVALVKAIIEQESKFNPFAMRVENKLTNQDWYNKLLTEREKKNKYSYCSLGIMQVLYGIAKSEGYKGNQYALLGNVSSGIEFGVKHLASITKKYYYIESVISAYNCGVPKKEKGKFINQDYVDKVLINYKKFVGKWIK